jgi:hypothetical protein
MKKVAALYLVLLIVILTGCSSPSANTKASVSAIAEKYAPENTMMLFSFSSIDKLFGTMAIRPDSFMGEPNPKENRQDMIDKLGFDPADIAEIERIGFDTKKEFGIVMTDLSLNGVEIGKTSADIALLFPVKSGADPMSYIKNKLTSLNNENTVIGEENGMLTLRATGDAEFFLTVKADESYIVFNLAINSQNTASVFFGQTRHMSDSKNYTEVAKEIDMTSDVAFYFDSQIFATKNASSLRDLSLNPIFGGNQSGTAFDNIKFGRGSAFVTDLSSQDLIIRSVGFLSPDNPASKMIASAKKDRSAILGIEKKPALLLSAVLNASAYLDFLLESFPPEAKIEFENSMNEYKSMLGVDIRKEFIDLMAGTISFGIFDSQNINLMQYNTVLSLNIKDRNAMISTLDKIAPMANMQKMSEESVAQMFPDNKSSKDFDLYSINLGMASLFVMADNENLSICTSKDISSDIMNKGSASFTEKYDKKLAAALKNDQIYLFIDFAEAYIATKTIYGVYAQMSGSESVIDEKTDAFVNKLVHFYAFGNLEGEKMTSEMIVKTKFDKPFFIALQEEILKMKQ